MLYLSYLRSQLKSDWIRQGGFEVAEQLSLKTFFNKLTPSCHFWPLVASIRSEVKKTMPTLNLNETTIMNSFSIMWTIKNRCFSSNTSNII